MNYIPLIKKSVKANESKFNLEDKISSVEISELGTGENNINYLAIINNQKYVFRIAYKDYSQANMEKEFNFIKNLPEGVGPKPIYFDKSKKIMKVNYSVLSYIEGEHIKRWTNDLLKLHARTLAKLHEKKYSHHNMIKSNKKEESFSLSKKFDNDLKWWSKKVNTPFIKKLEPLLRDYIKEKQYLFNNLKYSLIHSDPCITNILYDGKEIHYIDWEWSKFGDPAIDVSCFFFEDTSVRPWMIKLNGKRLKTYFNEYKKHSKDKTIEERVDVWNTILRFFDYNYYVWKIEVYEKEISAFPKKHYVDLKKKYEDFFKKRFLK